MLFENLYNKMFKTYVDASAAYEESKNEKIPEALANLDDDAMNSFDNIVEIEKGMPKKEGQTTLWAAAFRLDKWYIVTKPEDNDEDFSIADVTSPSDESINHGGKPFIGNVNGSGWIFAFTDLEHANAFAADYKLTTSAGVARTIEMRPFQAVDWLVKYKQKRPGVTGVSFSEGKFGWHIPIYNLESIRSLLLNKRIIKRQK